MAATPKISPEQAEEVIGFFKKAVDESDVESVAKSLNLEVKDVQKLATGKAPKSFISNLLEKAGGTIEGLQSKFDATFRPETSKALVPIAQPGALVPQPKPGALSTIQQSLNEGRDAVTGAPMTMLPPPGRREELLSESLSEAQPRMDALEGIDVRLGPDKETVKKTAAGTAALATGYAAGKALMDKPLKEQPESGQVTQAAEFEKPEDLGTATDMAVNSGAIAPEQAEQIKDNVEKVKTVKDLIKEIKEENKREKTRLEWLRAIETIAHGLATAIGANALMNRGSPFAVDFSKGPQVDWESQFNRLQKDFDTQINAILKDEELQQKQKQFEAREARRAQEREEDIALKREAMDIRAKEAGITAEERKQAKQEKLAADATKSIETVLGLDPEKDANRLVTARGAMLKTARQLLGPDELNALTQQAAQNAAEKAGITTKAVRSFKEFLGMKPEPGKKDYALSTVEFAKLLNQKLSGEEPAPAPAAQAAQAAPAPEMVPMVAPDGRELMVPANRVAELEAAGAKRK